MLMCPVALLADAVTWLLRAGTLLMIRMASALAIAATAYSGAILLAENFDAIRGAIAAENTILSEVIDRPVLADTSGGSIRVAGVH